MYLYLVISNLIHVYVDKILGSKKSFFVREIITYEIKITFHLRNNYYEFSLNYIRTITNGIYTNLAYCTRRDIK